MYREFIYQSEFDKAWEALGLNDDDQRDLELRLLDDPKAGDVIQNTNGARKLRIELGEHGRSHGARVIYVDVMVDECIYLLTCYPKSKLENIPEKKKKIISNLVKTLKQ